MVQLTVRVGRLTHPTFKINLTGLPDLDTSSREAFFLNYAEVVTSWHLKSSQISRHL